MSKLFEILLSANEKNFEEFMNKRFSRMRTWLVDNNNNNNSTLLFFKEIVLYYVD